MLKTDAKPSAGFGDRQIELRLAFLLPSTLITPEGRHIEHSFWLKTRCCDSVPEFSLGGVLRKATEGRRAEPRMQSQIEQHRSQLEAYEGLCKQVGEDPADVALAWPLHNAAVTAPIIGPRTVEQLTTGLRSLNVALSNEVLRKLDDIWPGPGGEAPKAYAW